MKNAPNLWELKELQNLDTVTNKYANGAWYPARPIGFYSLTSRLRLAWMVFTGKSDAVVWPGEQ